MEEWKERRIANTQFLAQGAKTNRSTPIIAAEKARVIVAGQEGER